MRDLRWNRYVAFVLLVVVAASASGADPASKPAKSPAKPATKPPAPPKKRPPAVKKKVELKPKVAKKESLPRVAHIRVGGLVLSSPPDFSIFAGQTAGMTLREWLHRLAKARNDGRVDAVALEIDSPSMSWAQAQEFADAVKRLDRAKPVYAHVTAGRASAYLVGSAARELTMEPSGTLLITGLAAELTFFRGALDWLGIRPQLVQIGRYKGAAEPFTRTGPSRDLKGEYDKILDDLYAQLCEQIARQRRLTVPHVKQAIDNGPHDAPAARKYRLVDRLVAKADWHDHVVRKVSGKKHKSVRWLSNYEAKKPKQLDFSNPLALFGMMFSGRAQAKIKAPAIAIIHADGMIVPGKSGEGLFGGRFVGHKTMVRCFNQVAEDDRIKAVIFRINSPGGSALASELIFQAARKCAARKPVIASISRLGASGGYYIALGGQKILADPSALTGSIGVVGGKLAMSGLLSKLGISTYEMTRGRNAGLWMSRPWDEREQAVIRAMVARTYKVFVSRVKSSRGGRIKDVESVAQGRIFTARQAARNGLIDEVGGIREAVVAAQAAAKIKSSYILVLPKPRTILDMLYGGQASSRLPGVRMDVLGELAARSPSLLSADPQKQAAIAYLMNLARLLGTEPALAAMPYHASVAP